MPPQCWDCLAPKFQTRVDERDSNNTNNFASSVSCSLRTPCTLADPVHSTLCTCLPVHSHRPVQGHRFAAWFVIYQRGEDTLNMWLNRSSNITCNIPKPDGQLTGAIGFATQVCVCVTVVCAAWPVVGTIAGEGPEGLVRFARRQLVVPSYWLVVLAALGSYWWDKLAFWYLCVGVSGVMRRWAFYNDP